MVYGWFMDDLGMVYGCWLALPHELASFEHHWTSKILMLNWDGLTRTKDEQPSASHDPIFGLGSCLRTKPHLSSVLYKASYSILKCPKDPKEIRGYSWWYALVSEPNYGTSPSLLTNSWSFLLAMAAMFIMFHSCVKLPESISARSRAPLPKVKRSMGVSLALQVVAISAAGKWGFHQAIRRSSPLEKLS